LSTAWHAWEDAHETAVTLLVPLSIADGADHFEPSQVVADPVFASIPIQKVALGHAMVLTAIVDVAPIGVPDHPPRDEGPAFDPAFFA